MAQQNYDMPAARTPNTAYAPKRGLINGDQAGKRAPAPKKKPRPKRKGAY